MENPLKFQFNIGNCPKNYPTSEKYPTSGLLSEVWQRWIMYFTKMQTQTKGGRGARFQGSQTKIKNSKFYFFFVLLCQKY